MRKEIIRSVNGYLFTIICSIGFVGATPCLAEAPRAITAAQQGVWQQFWLPKSWVKKHTSGRYQKTYLLFTGPTGAELVGDHAPCWAPSRVVFGGVAASGVVTEHVLDYFNFCHEYEQFGGAQAHIEGVKLAIDVTGDLLLDLRVRQKAFQSPDQLVNDAGLRLSGEPAWIHRRYSPQQALQAANTP